VPPPTVILWSLDFFPLMKKVSGFHSFGSSFQFNGSSVTPGTDVIFFEKSPKIDEIAEKLTKIAEKN
jgi:hypothetical protein